MASATLVTPFQKGAFKSHHRKFYVVKHKFTIDMKKLKWLESFVPLFQVFSIFEAFVGGFQLKCIFLFALAKKFGET